jgi:catechol 2,3-dioxygenase-like lactoylglutathione lyase family enzyme
MAIKVVEIHHHGIRIAGDDAGLASNLDFYQGLLGLTPDGGRPNFPGIPGFWMNVGESGQIHLFGGEQPSPLAQGADKDPASPHLALAVTDIAEAKAELDRRGTPYWSLTGVAGPQAIQLFLRDPYGNMIELHQVDQCRCRAANRRSR